MQRRSQGRWSGDAERREGLKEEERRRVRRRRWSGDEMKGVAAVREMKEGK